MRIYLLHNSKLSSNETRSCINYTSTAALLKVTKLSISLIQFHLAQNIIGSE